MPVKKATTQRAAEKNDRPLLLSIILFPGIFYQWLFYTFVGGLHYSLVTSRTRISKSPAMTWIISAIFYVAFYRDDTNRVTLIMVAGYLDEAIGCCARSFMKPPTACCAG